MRLFLGAAALLADLGALRASGGLLCVTVLASCTTFDGVVASDPVEAGRYIVKIAACNDCHTPGFFEKGMEVPESEWLTGVPVGWRGPWGPKASFTIPTEIRRTPGGREITCAARACCHVYES